MKKVVFIVIIAGFAVGGWFLYRNNSSRDSLSTDVQPVSIINKTLMQITSPAFADGQSIPKKYSCDGDGINPPLEFKDVPPDAQSIVLIMDDPDAPTGTWTHWALWNIHPATASISENSVPLEAVAGKTSSGQNIYGGPCPPAPIEASMLYDRSPDQSIGASGPSGQHRYYFRAFALDTKLSIPARSTVDELRRAMEGHSIGQAELMGTYTR